jgi:hypothetical protein
MIEKLFIDSKDIDLVKEGIEDLSLFVMEIEKICEQLEGDNLSEQDKNLLIYKLKVLESYANKMNEKVKDAIIDTDSNEDNII